jgi:hypothetical protein
MNEYKTYILSDFHRHKWNISMDTISEKLYELIKNKELLYGEINPDNSELNLKNASHIIKNIRIDGYCIFGDVKFLNNKNGDVAKFILNNGGRFSMRALGSTFDKYDFYMVETILEEIITFDIIDN